MWFCLVLGNRYKKSFFFHFSFLFISTTLRFWQLLRSFSLFKKLTSIQPWDLKDILNSISSNAYFYTHPNRINISPNDHYVIQHHSSRGLPGSSWCSRHSINKCCWEYISLCLVSRCNGCKSHLPNLSWKCRANFDFLDCHWGIIKGISQRNSS